MEVRLLGPLRVEADDGSPIAVNGARLRALLGRLAIDVGRVVPADQLFDDLYGEEMPQSVANALQGLVSKLRRVLGRPQAIVNRGGGYALELAPDSVDLIAFDLLASAGRDAQQRGDHTLALSSFDEALGLWRGPALMDFAYEEFAQVTIARSVEAGPRCSKTASTRCSPSAGTTRRSARWSPWSPSIHCASVSGPN